MTIIEALRVLLPELDEGPFIYSVRDRVRENDDCYEGDSWDHPRVKRVACAISVVKAFLKGEA